MNLSIKQAAEKASVSTATIHNWIKSGKLGARKQGKSWQISSASLDLCLGGKTNSLGLTDEAFAQIASKVAAELKPVFQQALSIQQGNQTKTNELDTKTSELNSRVTKLEEELNHLKQSLTKQGSEKPGSQAEQPKAIATKEAKQPEKAEPVSKASEAKKADQPDEEKAEKWVRENVGKWLDERCPYGKAQGRTWRDLAANKGEKISLKGIESAPRAYLHAIENWQNCESVWSKMKAKVALEIVNKAMSEYSSHYSHPVEVGG